MPDQPHATSAATAELHTILDKRAIHCVYQPVVTIDGQHLIGFEALARGPAHTPWAYPAAIFAASAAGGRLPELDWICRAAAFRGALDVDLPAHVPLFINIEPASSGSICPDDLHPVIAEGAERYPIVAEITERAIAADPGSLLSVVDELRQRSIHIALDDIGVDAGSRAVMSLLHPDIIKIDRSVVHAPETLHAHSVIAAVQAEALRTGAVILAEGIETRQHLTTAKSIGATLGQGWLLGRPAPLPRTVATHPTLLPHLTTASATALTPFITATAGTRPSILNRHAMVLLSHSMEEQALHANEPTVLLANFQHSRHFDAPTRDRYRALSVHTALTAVFGHGIEAEPSDGVRGFALGADNPLTREWTVIVFGSRFAAGLFGRQITDGPEPTFEVVSTEDRELVLSAARALIQQTHA